MLIRRSGRCGWFECGFVFRGWTRSVVDTGGILIVAWQSLEAGDWVPVAGWAAVDAAAVWRENAEVVWGYVGAAVSARWHVNSPPVDWGMNVRSPSLESLHII